MVKICPSCGVVHENKRHKLFCYKCGLRDYRLRHKPQIKANYELNLEKRRLQMRLNHQRKRPEHLVNMHNRYITKKETILPKSRIQSQLYYINNKKNVNEVKRIYQYNRRHSDMNFKLRHLLSSRIWQALKNTKKVNSTIKLIGCSTNQLARHLESQFKDGMSWKNQGTWHIDHIRPLVTFDLTKEENQYLACHYTNLQPLWNIDNWKKGGRY